MTTKKNKKQITVYVDEEDVFHLELLQAELAKVGLRYSLSEIGRQLFVWGYLPVLENVVDPQLKLRAMQREKWLGTEPSA